MAIPSRHVIIIGAGPAGQAAAVCLQRRAVPFTLLERGERPAAALRRVDPQMTLLSPSRLSRLPGMTAPPGEPRYLTFRDFLAALDHYHAQHGIRTTTGAEVLEVRREGAGFAVQVRGADGAVVQLRGSHVVNATGIISSPQLPDNFEPAASSLRWKHSLDVRAADLRDARRLLVVGGGASAAEVIERWLVVRESSARAWLSLRSRLKAVPNPILGIDVHYLAWLQEQLPVHLLGWRAARLPEPMLGGAVRSALRQRLVTRVPAIASYANGQVTTGTGERLEPDLVVFATGFRYEARHLEGLLDHDPDGRPHVCCCESTRTPGLYLLGFRFGRTFASPYVRGIARDAAYVAKRIARA